MSPRPLLLVEDNDDDAELTTKMLLSTVARESVDWQVHRLSTLKEALEWRGPDPQAVLLDLGLPDAGKPERLTRTVVDRFETAAVVLLTGGDHDKRLSTRCLEIGALDVVQKHVIREKSLTDLLLRAIALRAASRKRLEDSRADMKIDPEMLIRTVNAAVEAAVARAVTPKLRKLQAAAGVEDTGVIRLADGSFHALDYVPPPVPQPPPRGRRDPYRDDELGREFEELREKVADGDATRKDRRRLRELKRELGIPSAFEELLNAHPVASTVSKLVLALLGGATTIYAVGEQLYDSVLATEERVERIERKLNEQRIEAPPVEPGS